MELVDDHRVFLIRLEPDIWEEIQHGTLRSLELLRPGRTERLPEFWSGDVLLLYHPELPDQPPAELSHIVTVRSELSRTADIPWVRCSDSPHWGGRCSLRPSGRSPTCSSGRSDVHLEAPDG
jgi:hypothetical protein